MTKEKWVLNRSMVAQYVGVFAWVVVLETHVVSIPVAFLLGPCIVCICLLLVEPIKFRLRWRRILLITGAASAAGYVITSLIGNR